MRVFFSRKTWMGIGIVCLSMSSVSGCKSYGLGSSAGTGWLSWFSPKPSASALSSTPPTKPSVATLPNPTATTTAGVNPGNPNTFASAQPPGGGHPAAPGGANGKEYFTGPYGMAAQRTAANPNGAAPAAYGGSAAPYQNQFGSGAVPASNTANAYGGGYQSPYAANGEAARMADARNSYSAGGDIAPRTNPYAASAPAAAGGNWHNGANANQHAPAGAYGPAMPAAYPESPGMRGAEAAPAPTGGSLAPAPGSGNWAPPPSAATQGAYLDRFDNGGVAPAANPAIAPTAGAGGYRPGSTGRNSGVMPTAMPASQPIPNNPNPATASSYPTTAYPTTGLPSVSGSAGGSPAYGPSTSGGYGASPNGAGGNNASAYGGSFNTGAQQGTTYR